jgi:hypothetical protein
MGNKESVQGDEYGNGTLDISTGDMNGSYLKGVATGTFVDLIDARLSVEKQSVEGMDAGEEYVAYAAPAWAGGALRQLTEVRFSGSPLSMNVYGAAPERDDLLVETDVNVALGIFGLGFEYDSDSYEWTYPESVASVGGTDWAGDATRLAVRGRADILPDDLWVELAYESLSYDLDEGLWAAYDTGELIGRAAFAFREGWSVVADIRHVTYRDVPIADGVDDESFFDPYLALLWSPRKNIELRLGYGVNPTTYADSPVEGRANGRERWRSQYLWDHSETDVVGAERALEDARIVSLMAVIAF